MTLPSFAVDDGFAMQRGKTAAIASWQRPLGLHHRGGRISVFLRVANANDGFVMKHEAARETISLPPKGGTHGHLASP
jgi:hypothetical protein